MTQQDMDEKNLRRQVEEAQKRLQAWSGKDEDLVELLPKQGLCSLCYLTGKTEQPNHDLILLCPHPSALFIPFAWSNGRLRAGSRYVADKSAFVDMLRAVAERYAGQNPEATGRWLRLHGAAQALVDACELAIACLSGYRVDEEVALAKLRSAVALAQGEGG